MLNGGHFMIANKAAQLEQLIFEIINDGSNGKSTNSYS